VHDYYLRSEGGETRHTAVFLSVLERADRSHEWLEQKRRQEGKARTLRNYPLTAEEAFAYAGDLYFAAELLEVAQRDALPPAPARRGDSYLKAWDIGRLARARRARGRGLAGRLLPATRRPGVPHHPARDRDDAPPVPRPDSR